MIRLKTALYFPFNGKYKYCFVGIKFFYQSYEISGKTALSHDNATKNIPPEVVKLRSKNSQGAAGQMVRTGVM
ncbi:MAG: hypothetical protein IPL55_19785 [Saprospiraceae bacterium]|nr:hypothetical protein [Saprospiraceae bacterium]